MMLCNYIEHDEFGITVEIFRLKLVKEKERWKYNVSLLL